jgi:hypothetical protein
MHNSKHSPYAHFKSLLLYDWRMFIEFHPSMNIFLFKLEILFHKYFCQIHDFTMRLWHLNRVHFAKSPERDEKQKERD